jgi:hypothetical protein
MYRLLQFEVEFKNLNSSLQTMCDITPPQYDFQEADQTFICSCYFIISNVTVNSNESRISEQTPPSVLVQMRL